MDFEEFMRRNQYNLNGVPDETSEMLEGILSPSDIPLFSSMIDAANIIRTTLNVLMDRNCIETNQALFFSTLASLLSMMYPELQKVNKVEVIHFCHALHEAIVEMVTSDEDEE